MKYVAVTGGVVSGLGKGITSSSIGVLLKQAGLNVTSIKIDPYLVRRAHTPPAAPQRPLELRSKITHVREIAVLIPCPLCCVLLFPP